MAVAMVLMDKFGPVPRMGETMDITKRWAKANDCGRDIWLKYADDVIATVEQHS